MEGDGDHDQSHSVTNAVTSTTSHARGAHRCTIGGLGNAPSSLAVALLASKLKQQELKPASLAPSKTHRTKAPALDQSIIELRIQSLVGDCTNYLLLIARTCPTLIIPRLLF